MRNEMEARTAIPGVSAARSSLPPGAVAAAGSHYDPTIRSTQSLVSTAADKLGGTGSLMQEPDMVRPFAGIHGAESALPY